MHLGACLLCFVMGCDCQLIIEENYDDDDDDDDCFSLSVNSVYAYPGDWSSS